MEFRTLANKPGRVRIAHHLRILKWPDFLKYSNGYPFQALRFPVCLDSEKGRDAPLTELLVATL